MGAKTEVDLFSQDELEKIRQKASNQGHLTQNPIWKRAYYRLADAADHLCLMNENLTKKGR